MSTLSVTDVLRSHGFSAPSNFSGLPKNVRKHRNAKIKRAAKNGAPGISALMGSSDYTQYVDPARFKKKQHVVNTSTRLAHLPGLSDATGPCGGWGRLPNVSPIDYADDDPRGWVHVSHMKRMRKCMIVDEYAD